jgi:hypothetical protein
MYAVVVTDFPRGTGDVIGNNFGYITLLYRMSPFMILLWEVRAVGSFKTNADSSIMHTGKPKQLPV